MVRPKAHLATRLDKDVYQIVCKYFEQQQHVSISQVYDSIQQSNSSLRRIKKKSLEDSIERAIAVLQQDRDLGASDSEAAISEADQQNAPRDAEENIMNRHIINSMKKKQAQPREVNGGTSTPDDARASQPAHDSSKSKRRQADTIDLPARPAKRSKTSRNDTSVLPAPTHVTLADIGGLDHVIELFKESLLLPLMRPERYMRRGLKIPRGILLHGPPGCGKTMLCEAVAGEMGVAWLPIQGPSIVSGMSGESEKALRQHFEAAVEAAPCIMFIDEIDAITPKRETAQREMERRIVGQLLTCMDDLALDKTGGKAVIVLAATNRPDSLDPALRRAGRFDTEINIGVPNDAVRESILRAQTRRTEVAADVNFATLAKMTPGFVGADLDALIYKAGSESDARYIAALKKLGLERERTRPGVHAAPLEAEKRPSEEELRNDTGWARKDEQEPVLMDIDLSDPQSSDVEAPSKALLSFRHLKRILDTKVDTSSLPNADDALTMADFIAALPKVQPSAKREGFATIPDTTWSAIGALQSVRHQLHNAIVEPIRHPEKYRRFGISVPAGVLLWGPPGCGKTLLAKAVANESKANFISVKGPELLNKYVGESERAVRQVFFRAASSAPCVIFFDELDALVPRRDDSLSEASARVVNTLLTELDGLTARKDIYVIAATNRPEMIDPAMLRPGRLGKHLAVWLPSEDERVDILKTLLVNMPVGNVDDRLSLAEFARRCTNFSGADLSSLAYEAAQKAVERDGMVLELRDLELAILDLKPSVGAEDLKRYERFKAGFSVERKGLRM